MAKNRNPESERNPFKVVLYILIVLALIGCIGFLFYENRQRKAAYREEIEQMASGETEYVRAERMSETETEKQTEKQTEQKQSGKNMADSSKGETETESESESETDQTDAAESTESESETELSAETESETETESESESESESEETKTALPQKLRSIKIVVLNASGKEGAASMWKEVLEKGGYKTISVGSYSHKEEGTTIYTKNAELGDDLRSIFPNSNVYESGMDEVKSEIELPGTVENANNADAYIVVGKNNTEVF